MKKFIIWHKLTIGKLQNFLRINNYETLWLSWLKGLIMGILIMILFSCGVSKTTTHNCELMKDGQKCLPDHSCCK